MNLKFLSGSILYLFLGHVCMADPLVPVNLLPDGFGGGRQPQVAVSPQGDIDVVFAKGETVYMTASTDHGATFSAPVKVADSPGMAVGMRRGPRIAVSANRILVSADGQELNSYISDDQGRTWTGARQINDLHGVAAEGLQNITALPDGSFYAVWLDSRGRAAQIEGARLDAGDTAWGKNVTVYKSPDKTVCQCCHPSIVADGKGKLVAMWRNVLGGNRDFFVAESTDRGDSFSAATQLGTDSWKLNACPMDGGNLIANADGSILTIWRRKSEIYLDKPGQPEQMIGKGMQPVLAEIAGQDTYVWQQGGNIMVSRDMGKTSLGSFPGSYPSFAASPDNKEGYLVWETDDTVGPQFALIR